MDKLGGTRIVLLLHHADMGVNSNLSTQALRDTPVNTTDGQGRIILQWVHIQWVRRQHRKCLRRWRRKMRGGNF